MKEKILRTEETIVKEKIIFIANDGTEFIDRIACQSYEKNLTLKKLNETVEKADLDSPNFDGRENYESHSYHWYRPKNKEELKLLIDAFGDEVNVGISDIGKWICIETDCGDDYTWTTTLEDGINYARSILDKLGFDMEIKPKENA